MSTVTASDAIDATFGGHGMTVDPQSIPLSKWPAASGGNGSDPKDLKRYQPADGAESVPGAELPEIVIYEHINFGGASWRTNLNYLYVGDWWNDRISSIVVVRGRWRFYQHINYGGAHWDLGQGYYPWVENANMPNDIVSSFKFIGW